MGPENIGGSKSPIPRFISPLSLYITLLVLAGYLGPTLAPLCSDLRPPWSTASYSFLAFFGLVVLAYASVVDIWIFFGSGTFLGRWLTVLAANLIPIGAYAVGIGAVQLG